MSFEEIPHDILRTEIIGKNLNNQYQLRLLSQVNKSFSKIVSSWNHSRFAEIERKKKQGNKQEFQDFFLFVESFVSRKDFDALKIKFRFSENYKSYSDNLFNQFCNLGLFESVKYICENNNESNNLLYFDKYKITPNTRGLVCAISSGHLKIVKYFHQIKEWSLCDFNFALIAAKNGHLNILEYLFDNGYYINGLVLETAIENGHLEIVKYLFSKGGSQNYWELFLRAIEYGRQNILEYLHKNGLPWNETCCSRSAQYGQLECLKYLHENGCPWSEQSNYYATLKGHLDILKYLDKEGCPRSDFACVNAILNDDLEMLKYLREKGYSWDKKIFFEMSKNQEIKNWIQNN